MIIEVVNQHLRPREFLQHGQIVWMAVSLNDPPSRKKQIRDTEQLSIVST